MPETAEHRPWSRLEVIEADASGLCDGRAIQVAIICHRLAAGEVLDLAPAIRAFFGELAAQIDGLIAWRQAELERIEAGLADVEDEPPGEVA